MTALGDGSKWDVVVVGAGPAGSTAAALLAERGHRVLLVDRSDFPRRKPCGESVNPGAVGQLQELGVLAAVRARPHRSIDGWRVHPQRGRAFEGRFPQGNHGIGIDRAVFDQVLLERATAAGTVLAEGVHIVDVVRQGAAVAGVKTADGEEILARLVVAADGLRSVIVRRLGWLRRRPRLRKVAITAHVSAVSAAGTAGPPAGELFLRPWGCAGVAEIAPGLSNVVLVLSGDAGAIGGDPAAFFDRAIRDIPRIGDGARQSEALTTGPFDAPTRRIAGDGVLLVGDAAGYYDPFTGQGIYRALAGARLAASAADAALSSGNVSRSALSGYEIAHNRAFRTGRLLQYGIEFVTSRPAVFRPVAAALRRWQVLPDHLVSTAGDIGPLVRNLHRRYDLPSVTRTDSNRVSCP
ncbi:MAG: FAD-dependent oxidoreductase [Gemmatimonadota bacterium]